MSSFIAFHAKRSLAKKAANSQPNGYAPISESELQALKSADEIAGNLLAGFFKAAA